MKQLEPIYKKVGEDEFCIFPMSAFAAANLSGNLIKTIAPAITVLMSMFDGKSINDIAETQINDIDGEAIAAAFAGIDGDKLEKLLKQTLLGGSRISVTNDDYPEGQRLTEDIINELFCLNVQNMFVLAFHVIMANYSGFFKKPMHPSGDATEASTEGTSGNTAISMLHGLVNSN